MRSKPGIKKKLMATSAEKAGSQKFNPDVLSATGSVQMQYSSAYKDMKMPKKNKRLVLSGYH